VKYAADLGNKRGERRDGSSSPGETEGGARALLDRKGGTGQSKEDPGKNKEKDPKYYPRRSALGDSIKGNEGDSGTLIPAAGESDRQVSDSKLRERGSN